MVVRREVLTERLAGLREALRRLDLIRAHPLGGPDWEWAIERGLQVAAAQSVFHIGNHILSGQPSRAAAAGPLQRHSS